MLTNLRQEFKKGSMLNKIIYINLSLFLFFSILSVLSFMFQFDIKTILNKLYLPADTTTLLKQPWTFITYMFLHNGFLHLLVNMLWLHFAGKIFLQYMQPKQLLSTYILGGISGGLLFIIAFNYIPVLETLTLDARALGASASVLAIMVAIATYSPNYSVYFPFIGNVKLNKIAIVCVIIDILSIPNGNAGGHIAHLGGAIFGYFYAKELQKGNDFSFGFSNFLNKLVYTFKNKSKLNTIHKRFTSDYEFNKSEFNKQKEIDIILEKIANSGYESLSKSEKETLFTASKK